MGTEVYYDASHCERGVIDWRQAGNANAYRVKDVFGNAQGNSASHFFVPRVIAKPGLATVTLQCDSRSQTENFLVTP